MQGEDGGAWTLGVIEEANDSDHKRWSYIIQGMEIGRPIKQNMKYIQSTME